MIGTHLHYIAADPGFTGAFALINQAGTVAKVWPLPVDGTGKEREYSLEGMHELFKRFCIYPDVGMGLEWPQTWPGEPPEPAAKLRQGMAYIEAFAYLMKLPLTRVPPNLWTGRLGLPGKDHAGWKEARVSVIQTYYPAVLPTIYGPRGGLLDGPLDALLIAHWMRTQNGAGIRAMVARHGKNSTEVQAFVLGGLSSAGRRRRGMLPRIPHAP